MQKVGAAVLAVLACKAYCEGEEGPEWAVIARWLGELAPEEPTDRARWLRGLTDAFGDKLDFSLVEGWEAEATGLEMAEAARSWR